MTPAQANDDHKPAQCTSCGGRASVEHVVESERHEAVDKLVREHLLPMTPPPARRYAQVICRICDTRGPRVLFLAGDEWPHIAAEKTALAKWDCLHRMTQCN